jgi:SpoVK/Ycf46/Vps4 family AAA+-type ATPase
MPKVSRIASRLEELALPADGIARLRTVAAERVGAVVLRVPAGTDRTRAAEALARTMGHDLVRVDLGGVISRYAGETEKNLDRLFETAAASGAVLFFDEADALLGKRTDIKDSHDRYANLEVAYLLQKIESHVGIVILASSARQAIDSAFLRRLRHVVDLPWPPDPA